MGINSYRLLLNRNGNWERSAVVTKIDDYSLSQLSNEAENFKEDVQNILNFGKYSSQVVTNTPPSWTARNGEFVFFVSGTLKRIYFYNNNAWDYIEYNAGTVGGLTTVVLADDVTYGSLTMIDGLSFSIGANQTWTYETQIWHNSLTAAISAFKINAPGGSSLRATYLAVNSAGGNIRTDANDVLDVLGSQIFFREENNEGILHISAAITSGSSSGSVTFSAKRSDVSNTGIIKNGSYLVARKVA